MFDLRVAIIATGVLGPGMLAAMVPAPSISSFEPKPAMGCSFASELGEMPPVPTEAGPLSVTADVDHIEVLCPDAGLLLAADVHDGQVLFDEVPPERCSLTFYRDGADVGAYAPVRGGIALGCSPVALDGAAGL